MVKCGLCQPDSSMSLVAIPSDFNPFIDHMKVNKTIDPLTELVTMNDCKEKVGIWSSDSKHIKDLHITSQLTPFWDCSFIYILLRLCFDECDFSSSWSFYGPIWEPATMETILSFLSKGCEIVRFEFPGCEIVRCSFPGCEIFRCQFPCCEMSGVDFLFWILL